MRLAEKNISHIDIYFKNGTMYDVSVSMKSNCVSDSRLYNPTHDYIPKTILNFIKKHKQDDRFTGICAYNHDVYGRVRYC